MFVGGCFVYWFYLFILLVCLCGLFVCAGEPCGFVLVLFVGFGWLCFVWWFANLVVCGLIPWWVVVGWGVWSLCILVCWLDCG